MANHKSCEKKWRVNERCHKENLERTQRCKAEMKKLRKKTSIEDAEPMLNNIKKYLDKIGSKHIYHKNKVNRLKSRCDKFVNSLRNNKNV